MPVYRVVTPDNKEHLVDASNQASARSLVARNTFKVEVAKGVDLFRLAKAGVELQTVGEEPAEPEPEPEPEKK